MSDFLDKFNIMNKNIKMSIEDKVKIGSNITIGPRCKRLEIGYGSFIGDDIYIDIPELYIGDYTTIHRGTTLHGYKNLYIGHNCWIGQYCIIDSIGGTKIGNNVGIGAFSQLWSHIKFGDMLEGCKWNMERQLIVEDDVWFVGHCIVSPIHAKRKSMLMVGGVITKDMEENHIYGGSPAKDLTEKLGGQFQVKTIKEKKTMFLELYNEFLNINKLDEKDFKVIIKDNFSLFDINNSYAKDPVFFINDRMYIPTRSDMEYKFMKFLLYDKAKFIPIEK
ncbi:MAG: hypothetical protein KZY61_03550 [Clostridiaceae bacterium]|nr:hypothetical protein [Clostridiaceae bacterium]MBW4860683.1 hypothetical protein [Clostridiaceae bacterium]MBW4867735.1 hypothetical protein [Clostridiaceae bacterium]